VDVEVIKAVDLQLNVPISLLPWRNLSKGMRGFAECACEAKVLSRWRGIPSCR
jgi:hypothetical protein